MTIFGLDNRINTCYNKSMVTTKAQRKKTDQEREVSSGRYAPSGNENLCVCGHTLGVHCANRRREEGKMLQECWDDECDCECYRKSRKKPTTKG